MNDMTAKQITLSDIYEVVNRLEDKIDIRMTQIENDKRAEYDKIWKEIQRQGGEMSKMDRKITSLTTRMTISFSLISFIISLIAQNVGTIINFIKHP